MLSIRTLANLIKWHDKDNEKVVNKRKRKLTKNEIKLLVLCGLVEVI